MTDDEVKKGASFFAELTQRFRQEEIECAAPEDDRLLVLLDGCEIGAVTQNGGMLLRKEFLDNPAASDLCHQVGAVAAEVHEYMELMENAPLLEASSLSDPYKLLADFNGYVLGGMESKHGVQFTTWMWTYGKDGLTLGHYCENDYAAAKQDFALRTGLVQKEKLFSPEQLTEIYRCIQDTLDHQYDITYEQEALLKETQEQIMDAVPDLPQRVAEAQAQEETAFSHPML